MKNPKLITLGVLALVLALVGGLMAYSSSVKNAAATPASGITEVTKDTFQTEVLDSKLPVFIVFYAPNCKPCADEAPLIADMAKEYAGKVKFVQIDAVAQPELTSAIGVTAVPTMLVAKPDEQTVIYNEGFLDKPSLKKFIEDGLAVKKQP
jgi:thioredoxin 1